MKNLWPFLFTFMVASCVASPEQLQQQLQNSNLGLDEHQYTSGAETGDGGESDLESSSKEGVKEEFRDLTDDYTNIPASHRITELLDRNLSSPTVDCSDETESQLQQTVRVPLKMSDNEGHDSPAAFGARKVLATLYQSCKVLDISIDPSVSNLQGVRRVNGKRQVYNVKSFVNSHAVLSELAADKDYPGPLCHDATKIPPVYGYGSRKYPDRNNEINLFTKGDGVVSSSKPVAAIDCSSFISVAFATQGLKVRQTDRSYSEFTTTTFDQILDRPLSCIKSSKFTVENPISIGDIINVAGSHIVMIDEVGDDPLGIKKHLKNKSCDKISIGNFDFTYIHSGAINNSYGPSRVHISEHRNGGGVMFNNLRLSAVSMCKKFLKDPKYVGRSSEVNPDRNFSIASHQSDDPNCINPKPAKLKGEACVEKCLKEDGWS